MFTTSSHVDPKSSEYIAMHVNYMYGQKECMPVGPDSLVQGSWFLQGHSGKKADV